MRLSERSYPHPVVGNRDDVPGVAFQPTLEMTTDAQNIFLTIEIACSSESINQYVTSKQATYVVHVDCTSTLFRKSFVFSDPSHRIAIPIDHLSDTIEVNVFVTAREAMTPYVIKNAHPDYGTTRFEVANGDILAVSETTVFHIESNFDALRRIGSIMQIHESPRDVDAPMKIDLSGDKIVVFLSKNDFATYKVVKTNEQLVGSLTAAIVLPALITAVYVLREESDLSLKWAEILSRRISELNIPDSEEPYITAQNLLELPLRRALVSAEQLIGN